MVTLHFLVHKLGDFFDKDLCESFVCALFQQSMEKIDKIRYCAGKILFQILHHEPAIPFIPHHQQLKETFPK
jgi:hypothetical protein